MNMDIEKTGKDLKNKDDFASLRLNTDEIKISKIQKYVSLINAPQIKKRLNKFVDYLNDTI